MPPRAENERKAERYEQVIGADQQPVENLLEDKDELQRDQLMYPSKLY